MSMQYRYQGVSAGGSLVTWQTAAPDPTGLLAGQAVSHVLQTNQPPFSGDAPDYNAASAHMWFATIDISTASWGIAPDGAYWKSVQPFNALTKDYGPRILVRDGCDCICGGKLGQIACGHSGSLGERTSIIDIPSRSVVSLTTVAGRSAGVGITYAAGAYCQPYMLNFVYYIKWTHATTFASGVTALATSLANDWGYGAAASSDTICLAAVAAAGNRVIFIDPVTRLPFATNSYLAMPGRPSWITYGDGKFLVSCDTSNSVQIIDARTRTLLTTVNVGAAQYQSSYGNGRFFVCISGSATLAIIDSTTYALTTLILPNAPRIIASSPSGYTVAPTYSNNGGQTINSATLMLSQAYSYIPASMGVCAVPY